MSIIKSKPDQRRLIIGLYILMTKEFLNMFVEGKNYG